MLLNIYIKIDFLTAGARILLLVLTPSLISFFPLSTNNDHGKLRHIKAQPHRPSSSPCGWGEGPCLLKRRWEKRARQSDRTRGRGGGEGELSDLRT